MRIYTLKNVRKKLLTLSFLTFSSFTYAQYCTPSSSDGCGAGDDVNSFIISGENGTSINQSNTGCSAGDYSDMTSLTVNLSQGLSYTASISSEYNDFGDGDYCAIWIDLNDDQTFQSSEMVGFSDDILSLSGSNVTINIPASAPLGAHRMRVTAYYPYDENFDLISPSQVDPCNAAAPVYSYGETEDYMVNIVPPPACPAPTNLTATTTGNSATVSWTGTGNFMVEYGLQGFTPGTGATAGTGGTVIANASSPQTILNLDAATAYTVYVRQNCSASSNGFSSNASVQALTSADNISCNTAATLEANVTCITTSGTTIGATASNTPDCASDNNGEVWYKFVATQTEHLVSLSNVTTIQGYPYYVWGLEVSSGTCGNLTPIGCTEGEEFFGTEPAELLASGLTVGNTYYVRVWDDIMFDEDFNDAVGDINFDICVTGAQNPPTDCASLETPEDGDNAGIYPYLSWDETPLTSSYKVFLDTNNPPTTLFATTSAANYTPTTPLTTGTTYYWYVTPQNAIGGATGCESNVQSFTVAAPPANDVPSNAVALNVGEACTGSSFTNENANHNPGEPYPSCQIESEGQHSVWYSFVAPPSGGVRITTDIAPLGTLTDTKIGLFSVGNVNNYSTYTLIACDDDNGTEGSGFASTIFTTDLVANQIYYIEVDGYNATQQGTFCLQVEEINPTMITNAASCTDLQTPVGNNPAYTGWVTLLDEDGYLVANVRNPAGGDANEYSGSYNIDGNGFGMPRQDANGRYYLSRNYVITNSTISTPVDVRFYFQQGEIATLAGVTSNETNLSNLNVTKQEDDNCNANFDDANGSTSLLTQNANGNVNAVSWIQVSTSSFSNFYLMGGSTPLQISLKTISAENAGAFNIVKWTTEKIATGDYFELERGADAKHFNFVTKITANLKSPDYSFNDNNPLQGENFYRLKMVSKDGKSIYSKVVSATVASGKGFDVFAYPNPTRNSVQVKVSGSENGAVTLSDITGRLIYQSTLSGTEATIDLSKVADGVYFIKYTDSNSMTKTIKINKQ